MKKWVLKPQIVFCVGDRREWIPAVLSSSSPAETFNFRAFDSKGVG